eukprot:NODE_4077_length_611_cov_179.791815_g2927_i0.p1 GENE.NODE_4077_length_611_cov_179.791815_g2927_i0~~NODE_4077_length_611_cov_179.791815_g2927_i0.p1  ORF type:complete len:108 (-),score=16.23 NODE_4077_length_611_cov_179.791815_g2927_i0:51-374(-)
MSVGVGVDRVDFLISILTTLVAVALAVDDGGGGVGSLLPFVVEISYLFIYLYNNNNTSIWYKYGVAVVGDAGVLRIGLPALFREQRPRSPFASVRLLLLLLFFPFFF